MSFGCNSQNGIPYHVSQLAAAIAYRAGSAAELAYKRLDKTGEVVSRQIAAMGGEIFEVVLFGIDLAYAIYALAHGAHVEQVKAAIRSRDLRPREMRSGRPSTSSERSVRRLYC